MRAKRNKKKQNKRRGSGSSAHHQHRRQRSLSSLSGLRLSISAIPDTIAGELVEEGLETLTDDNGTLYHEPRRFPQLQMPYFNKLTSSLTNSSQPHQSTSEQDQQPHNIKDNVNNTESRNRNKLNALHDVKRNSRIGNYKSTTPFTTQAISRLPPTPTLIQPPPHQQQQQQQHEQQQRRPTRLSQLGSQQNLFAATMNSSQTSGSKLSVATPLLHKQDGNVEHQHNNNSTIATQQKDFTVAHDKNNDSSINLQTEGINRRSSEDENLDKLQNSKFSDAHNMLKDDGQRLVEIHNKGQEEGAASNVKDYKYVQSSLPLQERQETCQLTLPPTSRVQMTRIEDVPATSMRATPSDEVVDTTSQKTPMQHTILNDRAKTNNVNKKKSDAEKTKGKDQHATNELETIRAHMHHLQCCMGTMLERPVINSEIEADELAMNALFEHYDLHNYLEHIHDDKNNESKSNIINDVNNENVKVTHMETEAISPQLIHSRLEELDAQVLHRIRELSHEMIPNVTPTLLADKAQHIMEKRHKRKLRTSASSLCTEMEKKQLKEQQDKINSSSDSNEWSTLIHNPRKVPMRWAHLTDDELESDEQLHRLLCEYQNTEEDKVSTCHSPNNNNNNTKKNVLELLNALFTQPRTSSTNTSNQTTTAMDSDKPAERCQRVLRYLQDRSLQKEKANEELFARFTFLPTLPSGYSLVEFDFEHDHNFQSCLKAGDYQHSVHLQRKMREIVERLAKTRSALTTLPHVHDEKLVHKVRNVKDHVPNTKKQSLTLPSLVTETQSARDDLEHTLSIQKRNTSTESECNVKNVQETAAKDNKPHHIHPQEHEEERELLKHSKEMEEAKKTPTLSAIIHRPSAEIAKLTPAQRKLVHAIAKAKTDKQSAFHDGLKRTAFLAQSRTRLRELLTRMEQEMRSHSSSDIPLSLQDIETLHFCFDGLDIDSIGVLLCDDFMEFVEVTIAPE